MPAAMQGSEAPADAARAGMRESDGVVVVLRVAAKSELDPPTAIAPRCVEMFVALLLIFINRERITFWFWLCPEYTSRSVVAQSYLKPGEGVMTAHRVT